jgi:hypothetical protein
MIRNKSLLTLLLFFIVGSTVSTIPVQLSYSSSAEETSDEDQQGEPTGDEEPVDEEPVDEPEPETPSEELPISDEPVQTTATQEPIDPAPEREVCVTNANGQKFCYKELKPDEVCLKPTNAEDPPICPPPKPESVMNETTVEGSSSSIADGDPIPDIDVKLGKKCNPPYIAMPKC